MNEETRKTYTIRLPERIASRLEARATEAGTTPTTLIQSMIVSSFEGRRDSAKDLAASKRGQWRIRSHRYDRQRSRNAPAR